jgi:hypothetical protein
MNGVEILNEYTVASQWSFNYWAAIITFVILSIVVILVAIYDKTASDLWLLTLVVAAAVMLGSVVGAIIPLECHQEARYKVTVDDSVSMNEFLDKYEILDQEGKIYTVKERE